MKNKIKLWLLKTYYSIVGFFLIMKVKYNKKLYFVQNDSSNIITTYKYIGNNNFIVNTQCMEPTTGVVVFKEYKTLIKYWAIGCLFKNKIIKMK